MARTWPILFLSFLLSACGGESSDDPVPARNTTQDGPILSLNPPIAFSLASPDCQLQTAEVALNEATVTGWDGFQVTERRVSLNLKSKESLGGTLIQKTSWGDEFVRHCDWDRSGRSTSVCIGQDGRGSEWIQTKPMKMLRVCSGDSVPRASVEAVALTAAHALETSWQRILEHLPTLVSTTQTRLMVLPEYRSIYNGTPPDVEGGPTRKAIWTVNNLAYMPLAQNPTIVVYPPSQGRARSSPGWLWESQFAMAHELAHHLEFGQHTTLGSQTPMAWTSWDPVLHRKERLTHEGLQDSSVESINGPVVAEFDDAVSEAFADLSAWYVVGADDRSLRGLDCIGWNRSIANQSFKDGTAKILTPEVLATLTGTQDILGALSDQPQNFNSCEVPRFTSFHTVGAVIAHGLDQVWGASLETSLELRHRIAWAWIRSWRKSWQARKPSSIDELTRRFTESVENAIKSEMPQNFNAAAACKTWKEYFPATQRTVFADACT
jgi:hypothetical protein